MKTVKDKEIKFSKEQKSQFKKMGIDIIYLDIKDSVRRLEKIKEMECFNFAPVAELAYA